jgi:hypothetical protein
LPQGPRVPDGPQRKRLQILHVFVNLGLVTRCPDRVLSLRA